MRGKDTTDERQSREGNAMLTTLEWKKNCLVFRRDYFAIHLHISFLRQGTKDNFNNKYGFWFGVKWIYNLAGYKKKKSSKETER